MGFGTNKQRAYEILDYKSRQWKNICSRKEITKNKRSLGTALVEDYRKINKVGKVFKVFKELKDIYGF